MLGFFLFIKHTYVGEHTLVGRFSGILTQSGIVAAFKSVTVFRHFGEAAVPEGGVHLLVSIHQAFLNARYGTHKNQ
jgi:hypothetical protein